MADEQQKVASVQPEKKKDALSSLGLMQKVVLAIIIIVFVLIGVFVLLGGIGNMYELILAIIFLFGLLAIGWVILFSGELTFKEKYFSPKEDYFTRTVNLAIDHCPDNIKGCSLYYEGSDWKKSVLGGTIIGCVGLPDYIGEPVMEKVVYERKDKLGNVISRDERMQQKYVESPYLGNRKIPAFKDITIGNDGDTLLIYEKGFFLWKRKHYLRCHRSLHTELNGDVVIHDINPTAYGKFWLYPYKQLQAMPSRVQIQSQIEVILATYEYQGDLISQGAEMGLNINPFFRAIRESQTEIMREG